MNPPSLPFFWITCLLLPVAASGLELAPPFSDHMVLQAGRSIPVWGRAQPAAVVTVTYQDVSRNATAGPDGTWRVELPALAPTRSDTGSTLSAAAPDGKAEIHDVLVGEVWLCSGQSNMRFTLGRRYDPARPESPRIFSATLAASAHPRIRLLSVSGGTPANRLWGVCGPETAVDFSAVGYFFGDALQPALAGMPIGLIDLGRGGEPIRGFVSRALIERNPELEASVPALLPGRKDPIEEVVATDLRWLAPFAVRGVLWYQGESEVTRARVYPAWLSTLAGEWRQTLNSPDAPFLVVQLPVYERHRTDPEPKTPGEHWAELRAAQVQAAAAIPNVFLTPALDLGQRFEIHPHRKPELGLRLARLAEASVYGLPTAAFAPTVAGVDREGNVLRVRFLHTEGGLVALAPGLDNFELGLADGRFVPVQAEITGIDTVTVTLAPDAQGTALRYGWRDFFVPSLFNGEGLPALPFSAKLP